MTNDQAPMTNGDEERGKIIAVSIFVDLSSISTGVVPMNLASRVSVLLLPLVVCSTGCRDDRASQVSYDTWIQQNEQYQRQLDKADEQSERLDKTYDKADEQSIRLDKQQDRSDKQADRFDKLLKRWEEQADRYDKILDKWEKQEAPSGATKD